MPMAVRLQAVQVKVGPSVRVGRQPAVAVVFHSNVTIDLHVCVCRNQGVFAHAQDLGGNGGVGL